MMKKCSAPMTADKSNPEAITQRGEMHRNEAKDVQWETVDGGQQVPPFVDGCRSGRDAFGELRELEKVGLEPRENLRYLTMSLELPGPRSNCDNQLYGVLPWEDQLTMENRPCSSVRH